MNKVDRNFNENKIKIKKIDTKWFLNMCEWYKPELE